MRKIAESKVSTKFLMSIPSAVRMFFQLKEGDILVWFPATEDIPEDVLDSLLLVGVKREVNAKK